MSFKFYDKVAKKFGRYHTNYRVLTEYPNQAPEVVFKSKLIEVGGKGKIALDMGCGDGRFILSIAPNFEKIIGIDLSEGMLEAARKLKKEKGLNNIELQKQDVFHTLFENKSFDVIYSRRGPTPFSEAFRLLKPGGCFIEIDIGEKDTQELKEVFGRGQNFGKWNTPRIEAVKQKARKIGFNIIFAKEFFYSEYYPTYKDLDVFLQGVPIFEDFDSVKDKKLLKKYVNKFKTKKGIKLLRHRVVAGLRKPNSSNRLC
jgi:ubiquinone/menaquinone biosynthesis C-methylase UbiE